MKIDRLAMALLGAICLAVLLAGCGSGTGPTPIPEYTGPTTTGQTKAPNTIPVGGLPGAPPAPAPAPNPSPTTSDLEVTNNGNLAVFFLYVSPSSSTIWGPDQLGAEVIMPGETFTLTNLPPDTYDSMAEYSDGTQVVS
jgi:hypothetical protein